MKLSRRQHRNNPLELSMTSMIDVVFLLLIFFIVTTTFVRPERQLLSAIQVREKQAADSNANLDPAIIDVVRQNGAILFRLGAVRTNDIRTLEPILQSFPNKSAGAFVRAADDAPYEAAAQAIGVCKAADFPTVSYLPLE